MTDALSVQRPMELSRTPWTRGRATAFARKAVRQLGGRRDGNAARSVDQPASATAQTRVPALASGR
jgi:hypothetical protein